MTRFKLGAAAFLVACSGSTSELPRSDLAANGLSVAVERTAYSIAEVSPGGTGIHATLTADGDKPLYARLGDAFNGAVDQNPLYAAEGSDGVVERQSGGAWVKVSTGILVEGVREVVLTPGKTYTLVGNLAPPVQPGTYRLKVSVRDAPGGAQTLAIQSAPFDVR
jgi:hypothetical protein